MKNPLFALMLLCLLAGPLSAADADEPAPQSQANETRVVAAKGREDAEHKAGMNDRITLTLRNRDPLLEQARNEGKRVIPYVDGQPLPGIKVLPSGKDQLEMELQRTDESSATWAELVKQRTSLLSTEVSLSVGLEGEKAIATEVHRFELVLVKKGWLVVCLIAVAGLLTLFLWLARGSNILRDPAPTPPGETRPYSIGRTQMAFWFFLVIICYPFIWLITGELSSITASVLGLMGISAGTALSATVIDTSKRNAAMNARVNLAAQRDALGTRLRELTQAIAKATDDTRPALQEELDAKRVRFREIEEQIKRLPPERRRQSKGFLLDLVSDDNGVSFHRFQILAWTLVLGIIFIAEVFTNLKMPEFSETLLALMGVSSGTYLGFKFPEEQGKYSERT